MTERLFVLSSKLPYSPEVINMYLNDGYLICGNCYALFVSEDKDRKMCNECVEALR